jgi:hypothetical protein
VIVLDVSSESEDEENNIQKEDGWWYPTEQHGIPLAITEHRIRTVTGIDPGTKNFSMYQYDIDRDVMRAWIWADINGTRKSKLTSKQVIQRIEILICDHPEYFDSDLIAVEQQMTINTKHFRMQKYLEQRFDSRCKVINPKKTKAYIFELMDKKDALEITGHTSEDSMSYSEKKKFGIRVGEAVMNAKERNMYKLMKKDRSEWKKTIEAYDKKLIAQGRTKAKKTRVIKVRPDDAFDSMLIALVEACMITGVNIIHRRIHWRKRKHF